MPRWNRLGLQLRIMVYVTAGLALLFGGLGYFDVRAIRDTTEQALRERIALAHSLAQDVQDDFEFLESDLRMAALSLNVPSNDFQIAANSIHQLLSGHVASQFFRVSALGILDGEGQLLATGPAPFRELPLPDPRQVQMAIAQRQPLVIPSTGTTEAASFVSVVVPVTAMWAGGQPLAVIADTIGVSGPMPAVPGGGTAYSMEILAADGRTVVATSQSQQVGRESAYYQLLREYIGAGLDGVVVNRVPRGASGDDEVVAVTPLLSGSFYLVLKQPADLALKVPLRRWKEMVTVGFAGIVILLGAAWYTTRTMVRSVEKLRAATREFAQGSLDKPVQVLAQDELGELAEDIETMRLQLKRSWGEIERAKLELELKIAERTQRLQETLGKIITAQEEERRRLARELHDEQSQGLGALSVSLGRISRLLGPASAPDVRAEIEEARDMAGSLLQDTRRLIYDLRPSVLDDMGLEAAIRWCAETHLERHGVEVTLRSPPDLGRLPGAVEVALFRVAQEAIVNVERHSQARHAGIVIERQDSSLRMQVWDDGKGFVPAPAGDGSWASGVGLEGIQERVRLIGGSLEVLSALGKGTTIKVEVPVD